MFQTKVAEKIITHFMFSNFFSKTCDVHEIMWKNELDRPQMKI